MDTEKNNLPEYDNSAVSEAESAEYELVYEDLGEEEPDYRERFKVLDDDEARKTRITEKTVHAPKVPLSERKPATRWLLNILAAFIGMFLGLTPALFAIVFGGNMPRFSFVAIPLGICVYILLFDGFKDVKGLFLTVLFTAVGFLITVVGYCMYAYVPFKEVIGTVEIYSYIFMLLGIIITYEIFDSVKKRAAKKETAA